MPFRPYHVDDRARARKKNEKLQCCAPPACKRVRRGVRGREQFRGILTFVYAVCVMGHGARVTKHLLQVP